MRRTTPLFLVLLFTFTVPVFAEEALRPYTLIDDDAAALEAMADSTREELADGGFQVVGEYSPYPGARVIAFTHPALLDAAARERFGGYAAVLRLGLTEVDGRVQRSYANPAYWGAALQVGTLDQVSSALATLFDGGVDFGSEKGLSAAKLAKYRYMLMMHGSVITTAWPASTATRRRWRPSAAILQTTAMA